MRNKAKLLLSNPLSWLFIVCLVSFWQVSLLRSGLHWDMLDVHLPWLSFMSEVLRSGELHYWNPYQELGYPFHADMMSTWYPPGLLVARFIGFDLIVLQYYFLFHLFIAGCGMYLLLMYFHDDKNIAFMGAAAYMLCGLAVSNAQHLFIICSLAWIPFVLNYFLRTATSLAWSDLLKLSIVTCFMVTGGYPFLTVVTLYLVVILFFLFLVKRFRKDRNTLPRFFMLFISGVLVTLFLCLPMIIAMIQVFPELERGTALSVETAISYPYTLRAFWFFLVPFSLGNNWEFFETDISMVNIYTGIVFFVFMIYGLFKKATNLQYLFFGFGLLSLAGALARELPVMTWMVTYIPLFDYFRFPALFRLFFISGMIIFAANALRLFLSSFQRDKGRLIQLIIIVSICLFGLIIYGIVKSDLSNLTFFQPHETFQKMLMDLTVYERLFIGGSVQLAITLVLLLIVYRSKDPGAFLRRTLFLLLADMFLAVQMNINYTVVDPIVDPIKVNRDLQAIIPQGFPVPKRTNMLHAKNESTAVLGIWRNVNNFTKEPAVDGFSSFWLNNYIKLEKDTMLSNAVLNNPIVYLSSRVFTEDSLAEHKKKGRLKSDNIYLSREDHQALQASEMDHAASDTAFFLEFKPNHFKIRSVSGSRQLLTILQSAYKGWNVKVNGKETDWVKSNYLFMSVVVPAGTSDVDFVYENRPVKAGFVAAALTFFTVIVILITTAWRKNRKEGNFN